VTRLIYAAAFPMLAAATVVCVHKSVRNGRVQGPWWHAGLVCGVFGTGAACGVVWPPLAPWAVFAVVAYGCRDAG
jgi:hypothetical protein